MSNKYNYDKILEHPDRYTTAERSLLNAKDIKTLEDRYSILTGVIDVNNLLFGDQTLVNTQATRAEDIVSVEDVRLQGEIDTKVDFTIYTAEQDAQDTLITNNANAITALDGRVTTNENNININSNNIASNDTDIANLQSKDVEQDGRLTAIETVNSNQDIAIANNATDIDSLEGEIVRLDAEQAVQDSRLDSVEAKDVQQDDRLTVIEGVIASVSKDSSVITPQDSPTPVDSTIRVVKATIDKDFVANSIATGGIEVGGEYTITANTDLILDIDYRFLATKVVGEPVRFTVELYNITQGAVMDSSENIINFAGNVSAEIVGIPLYSDAILAGDVLVFRVYTDGTNTVSVTEAKALIKAEQKLGTLDEIFDYNVISTSNIGGVTVLDAMNIIDAELDTKVDITTFNNSQAAQDAIIESLPTFDNLDSAIGDVQAELDTKANITYVDSQNAAQDVIIAGKADIETQTVLFEDENNTSLVIDVGVPLRDYKELIVFIALPGASITSTTQSLIKTHNETIRYRCPQDINVNPAFLPVTISQGAPTTINLDDLSTGERILKIIGVK